MTQFAERPSPEDDNIGYYDGWTFYERIVWYEHKVFSEEDRVKRKHEVVRNKQSVTVEYSRVDELYYLCFGTARSVPEGNKRYLGYREAFFGSNRPIGKSTSLADQRLLPVDMVRKFYWMLKVKPEHFLLGDEPENVLETNGFNDLETAALKEMKQRPDKGDKKVYSETELFTWKYWKKVNKYWRDKEIWKRFHHIRDSDVRINQTLVDAYEDLKPFYTNAKYRIGSHELLTKGNNDLSEEYEAYDAVQKNVYRTAQNHLKANPAFVYRRNFYCSLDRRLFTGERSDKTVLIQRFLMECSILTLEHIFDCWKIISDDPSDKKQRCSFYICPPLRHRQFTIIDNDFVLAEDFTTFISGNTYNIIPDKITVVNVKPHSRGRRLLEYVESVPPGMAHEITLKDLRLGFLRLKKRLESEIQVRKEIEDSSLLFDIPNGGKFLRAVQNTLSLYENHLVNLNEKFDRFNHLLGINLDNK